MMILVYKADLIQFLVNEDDLTIRRGEVYSYSEVELCSVFKRKKCSKFKNLILNLVLKIRFQHFQFVMCSCVWSVN